jgi:hypothetical protein
MQDLRLAAPAALRNRDLILDAIRERLPPRGLVLEIASGSGQHCVRFGERLPEIVFQPSDPDPRARASIDAWIAAAGVTNVRAAIALDAAAPVWPLARADAILCFNMIHIAPWRATLGLLAGAARLLDKGAPLVLYGPYKRGGAHTSDSNAAFDRSLREENPEWGVRDLDAVEDAAIANGFSAAAVTPMPANNLTLVFTRQGPGPG